MIVGVRPSLGFVGYMIFNKSVFRFAVAIAVFSFITALILFESNRTINLRFLMPSPFPPPVILLPDPTKGAMTALDSCSIEAATSIMKKNIGAQSSESDELHPPRKNPYRDISVFLWKSTLTTRDPWAYFASSLPGVHVRYLDVRKMVKDTPIDTWHGIGGLRSAPGWAVWAISAAALIWSTGGIAVPLGSVMTHSVSIDAYGSQMGFVVTKDDNTIDPAILGIPARHPVLEKIINIFTKIKQSVNGMAWIDLTYGSPEWTEEVSELLTDAMTRGCAHNDPQKRYNADECYTIYFADSSHVEEGTLEEASSNLETKTLTGSFFRFYGNPEELSDPKLARLVFRHYNLGQYCPNTSHALESIVNDQFQ